MSARLAANLTQVQVARALRIPQSQVSRMESGERRVDVIELRDMAELYRRPVSSLIPRSRAR